jgi:hypothetical protein
VHTIIDETSEQSYSRCLCKAEIFPIDLQYASLPPKTTTG